MNSKNEKMKSNIPLKYIFVMLCLIINFRFLFAQDNATNLAKYWHYRYRLTHYFTVIGEGPGMSIPAGVRNRCGGDGCVMMDWGEGPVQLGYYIGVLATEYKLLKDNNAPQADINQTLTELYYAMKTITRLNTVAVTNCGNSSGYGTVFLGFLG